jgi:hypothetical protein
MALSLQTKLEIKAKYQMHIKRCMHHIQTLKPCIFNLFHRFASFGLFEVGVRVQNSKSL